MRRHFVLLFFAAVLLVFFAPAAEAQECLDCHGDPAAAKEVDGKQVSVHVNGDVFAASVHGSFSCADCHADITEYPHPEKIAKVDCSGCHSDAQEQHAAGVHAKAANGPTCTSCHGNAHTIVPRSDPKSTVHHLQIANTCGSCHSQKYVMEPAGFSTQPFFSYGQSVHGRAVAGGSMKAASCTDCHNAHDIRPAGDPASPIFKMNVPQTCGKCHGTVTKVFNESVHGKAVQRGNSRSPGCTDCHGIHNIKNHIDPKSSVAAQNLARTACGQCHGNVQLASEFGFSVSRVETYEDSYHGLAKRLGSAEAANCASCHGVHNILPQSHRDSTIHPANLPNTCGTCHPGAGAKFATGKVHLAEQPLAPPPASMQLGDKVLRWVSLIYVPLIIVTLGGMALHNLIIWVAKVRRSRKNPTRTVLRMNRNQRIQHFLLLTSFITLVITGFALAYPGSWFGAISGGEEVRRVIHRVAAVVMMLLGIYHIGYMVGTKEGRKGLRDFWFSFKDAKDVLGVMKYHLGLSSEHPKMGRFTYAEKAEYWALVWGTIVMGITGLMLWFEIYVTTWLGLAGWWIDVALMIHFYEAILATLAIIIWHLYAVIFDPDVYPINFAWYDGKMPEHQFRHEHEAEWEKMKQAEAAGEKVFINPDENIDTH